MSKLITIWDLHSAKPQVCVMRGEDQWSFLLAKERNWHGLVMYKGLYSWRHKAGVIICLLMEVPLLESVSSELLQLWKSMNSFMDLCKRSESHLLYMGLSLGFCTFGCFVRKALRQFTRQGEDEYTSLLPYLLNFVWIWHDRGHLCVSGSLYFI